jgi:hypothetical protein
MQQVILDKQLTVRFDASVPLAGIIVGWRLHNDAKAGI